jgi:predicted deacetylase
MTKNNFLLSSSKYIIRLDDASKFSNQKKWKLIENILDYNNVKPIVAVIPKNEDKKLIYSRSNNKFWDSVRLWQKKDWSIAMHGYQHIFHKINRRKLMFPFYNRSEFGGLSLEKQKDKISRSLKIFEKNDINPTVWVAPGHSFDNNTIKAIYDTTDIRIISDGISYSQYFHNGFYFIPQQLWEIKHKRFGLWTVCLHPDTMTEKEIICFENKINLISKKNKIIDVNNLELSQNNKSLIDNVFSFLFWIKYDLKTFLS